MTTKNLKHTLTTFKFGKHTTHGVSKVQNKSCGVYNIIIKGISHTFEDPETIHDT